MFMELIPGLPDDIARECLFRISYKQLATVISVCRGWKTEVELPEFRRNRRYGGNIQKLIVMTQACVNSSQSSSLSKYWVSPAYRFTVLEPDTGYWSKLPPIAEFSSGLPMFCQLVSVGSDLVVLGGLDPATWGVSNSVYVFNFVSATWRRGSNIPGVRRSFFGCASDSDRMVYVVGGHDDEKNALRSAIAYDVAKDKWVSLPDMASERDECKAIFHRGKLHVIGGYPTDMQGRFMRSAEVFNIATRQWISVKDDFLEAAICPRTCVCDDNGEFYLCHGGDVVTVRGPIWQVAAKLPADVCNVSCVTTWQGKLLVIGSARFGEPYVAYVLDLKNFIWGKVESPAEYSGHVQSGCYLEI